MGAERIMSKKKQKKSNIQAAQDKAQAAIIETNNAIGDLGELEATSR